VSTVPAPAEPGKVSIRLVEPNERLRATEILLGCGPDGAADFLRQADEQGYDLKHFSAAFSGGRMVATLLAVETGGIVQVVPSLPPSQPFLRDLVDFVAARPGVTGKVLQTMMPPIDVAGKAAHADAGFREMARFLFVKRPIKLAFAAAPTPAGFEELPFTPESETRYVETIRESYRDSLDCPAMAAMRAPEGALAAHKETGEFVPELWTALTHDGQPAAILLLSPHIGKSALEVVYLGVCPKFRRRRLGDWAVRRALHTAYVRKFAELSLVVDASNTPALQLYFRHGFRRDRESVAMVRLASRDLPTT
jgi:ribosomal protein S18 acetylase RimI-like enzyme